MTALEVALLPAGSADAEIAALLAACPESFAQQTPGWRDVITGQGVDQALFLGCRVAGRLVGVLPGYRFEGPLGAILVSCAQAGPLGGIACLRDAPRDAVYAELVSAFIALARERGCALATLISNPIWPDRERIERCMAPDYVLENVCQVLDLARALDADGEPAQASANVRRNLRRAREAGLVVDEAQSATNVAEWYEIHAQRHREIGATPLPRGLFERALERAVPAGVARFLFVRSADSGELVAGGLYLQHGAVIDALMPSIRSDAAPLRANYLLALHSMQLAAARGARFYNWQGSPPGGGVHRFKMQWGSRDVGYAYLSRAVGDVSAFLASTPAEIAHGYPWHYALPFDCVGGGAAGRRVGARASAWASLEGGGS